MRLRPPLILASTSPYHRELLSRLRIVFEVHAPDVDETPRARETPAALAQRLARAKAHAVAERFPNAVVIGSDQVADLNGHPIGKPGDHERAAAQLRAMSGRSVVFHSAVAVVHLSRHFDASALVPSTVLLRTLSPAHIERYLRLEPAYDCAGSAKAEALGIALAQSITSDDPTALIGLPLIATCELLRRAGLDPLDGAGGLAPMP